VTDQLSKRRGRCWWRGHDWSKWVHVEYTSVNALRGTTSDGVGQMRRCLRCGIVKRRDY